jgi:hypothetical protein
VVMGGDGCRLRQGDVAVFVVPSGVLYYYYSTVYQQRIQGPINSRAGDCGRVVCCGRILLVQVLASVVLTYGSSKMRVLLLHTVRRQGREFPGMAVDQVQ